jgi:hypothetical protein
VVSVKRAGGGQRRLEVEVRAERGPFRQQPGPVAGLGEQRAGGVGGRERKADLAVADDLDDVFLVRFDREVVEPERDLGGRLPGRRQLHLLAGEDRGADGRPILPFVDLDLDEARATERRYRGIISARWDGRRRALQPAPVTSQ